MLDRDGAGAERVAAEIVAVHGVGHAVARAVDVAATEQLGAVVDEVAEVLGAIDIVVNNAGVAVPSALGQDDDSFALAWDRTLAVNLASYAHLVRRALPHLRRSDAPRVVNIASSESAVATSGLSAYAASKAGVTGLTRALAVELARDGITVNCVCPGPVNTGMTAEIPDQAKDTYARRRVALRRYGDPEEIAQMVVNFCLPAASFVTGATLFVDGGMTIRHT